MVSVSNIGSDKRQCHSDTALTKMFLSVAANKQGLRARQSNMEALQSTEKDLKQYTECWQVAKRRICISQIIMFDCSQGLIMYAHASLQKKKVASLFKEKKHNVQCIYCFYFVTVLGVILIALSQFTIVFF